MGEVKVNMNIVIWDKKHFCLWKARIGKALHKSHHLNWALKIGSISPGREDNATGELVHNVFSSPSYLSLIS